MSRRKKQPQDHPELGLPEVRSLWQTVGMFSEHYLKSRIQQNNWWPTDEQTTPLREFCQQLVNKRARWLGERGNEQDCRQELIDKILMQLGFAWSDNLRLPSTSQDLEPDYILYSSAEEKEAVLEKNIQARYAGSVSLLEAKKYGHPLSQISSHQQRYPHQQIRQYLDEAQIISWGILTNGKEWRLYCRDAKPSQFFAINFEVAIQSLENFKHFVALFSPAAFVRNTDGRCRLDTIRESALATQTELEADLRQRVFTLVEILANGFAERSENAIPNTPEGLRLLYENCLIFLYRLLFILYAEGRQLLPVEPHRKYYKDFSLARLIGPLKGFAEFSSPNRTRLYEDICELCRLINGTDKAKNREYSVPRYNGGLFDPSHHPELEIWRIYDAKLADVLRGLMFAKPDRHERELPLETVDYADLRVQQLGSIYEGLLEHHFIRKDNGVLQLDTDKAERKATGTYYTPDYIVKYIVENTVGPLLQEIENSESLKSAKTADRQDNSFADAVLALNILDPAMGSGHFLVEATTYLAEQIVYHPTTKFQAQFIKGESQEQTEIAYWRRRVVEACIYGVDLNPLAVELAKLSLWLTTIATDQPLNFLDHHLRCGNSLIGARLDQLGKLPERKKRKTGDERQITFTFGPDLKSAVSDVIRQIHLIETEASGDVDAVKDKESRWREQILPKLAPYKAVADLWTGTFFGNEIDEGTYVAEAQKILAGQSSGPANDRKFFHWEFEFPEVFFAEDGTPKQNPGFNAVIGNPPYGAELGSEERSYFQLIYATASGYKNTALQFIEVSFLKLAETGYCGLIIPKSFTFSEGWKTGRDLLLPRTYVIADVSKAFEGVLLEQVVIVFAKAIKKESLYDTTNARDGRFAKPIQVARQLCKEIDGFLIGISLPALRVFEKMVSGGLFFRNITRTFRGLPIQKHLKPKGDFSVFRGDHISRYALHNSKEFVNKDDLIDVETKAMSLKQPKLVCQNIVAHVTRPREHIIIMSCLDRNGNLNLDTVNNIVSNDPNYKLSFLLCLLNSQVISWYAYLFVYNQAIRTMHFDEMYVGKLPIPKIAFNTFRDVRESLAKNAECFYEAAVKKGDATQVLQFVEQELKAGRSDVVHDLLAFLAEQMMTLNKDKNASAQKFLTDLKDFHGVDAHNLKPKTKLDEFWELETADLFAHLHANVKTLASQDIRLKESDEEKIRDRFQKAKVKILPLESALTFTDHLIDQIVYRLYGLTDEEIKIVDPASHEASSFAEASPYAKPLRRDKSVDKTQGKGATA